MLLFAGKCHGGPAITKMCQQANLFEQFKSGEDDPKNYIKKSGVCRYCAGIIRVRPKYLDKRLGELAWTIYKFIGGAEHTTFRGDNVFSDHKDISDFQKLGYFGIIEKAGHCRWGLTYQGKRFLEGKIQLPSRVWVLNNRIVDKDDTMVSIDRLEARWQQEYQDYTLDYVPQLKII